MKDPGSAKRIFRMEISRDSDRGLLYLSQHNHLENVLRQIKIFRSQASKGTSSTSFRLSNELSSKFEEEELGMQNIPYGLFKA